MNYKRVQGGASLPKVECTNPQAEKWLVRWDYQPYINEEGVEEGVTFVEQLFLHKPTLDEVKPIIIEYINECVRQRIFSTLVWNGKPVWLSTENQMDWKAAFDRSLQTEGMNLPVKFKLGEDENGNSVYHTFTSLNAFADFTDAWQRHIQQCLADGWQMKDSIDWDIYANSTEL